MKKQMTSVVLDTYGNDLSDIIRLRGQMRVANKTRNFLKYKKQYARRGERL